MPSFLKKLLYKVKEGVVIFDLIKEVL